MINKAQAKASVRDFPVGCVIKLRKETKPRVLKRYPALKNYPCPMKVQDHTQTAVVVHPKRLYIELFPDEIEQTDSIMELRTFHMRNPNKPDS